MNKSYITLFALAALCATQVNASDHGEEHYFSCCKQGRPDGHAPIGVMGDHNHGKNEWMFSYRFMFMDMEGNRKGTSEVQNDSVLAPPANLDNFVVMPLNMQMEMHMFGLMYGVTDKFTIMGMLPYKRIQMEHVIASVAPTIAAGLAGTKFKTRSQGPGDFKLSTVYRFKEWGRQALLLNMGIGLPTGSINMRDRAFVPPPGGPTIQDTLLPYPMQLGSGSFEWLPGLTYTGKTDRMSWGLQGKGVIRINRNSEEYRLGDEGVGTAWVAGKFAKWISGSFRAEYKHWGDIDGKDARLTTAVPALGASTVPTAQSDLRGGQRLSLHAGVNLFMEEGPGLSQRLAIEVGVPVYQSLDGPQLETDIITTIGWQMAF